MEAIYFGNNNWWGSGAGSGPWIMADLENGLLSRGNQGYNANDPTVSPRFLTAIVKGQPNHWAIRGGNAQWGTLSTYYDGARPNTSGYNSMQQVQLLDCGGSDNQWWTYTASKQLTVYGSKCLDTNSASTANGTSVIIRDCNGGTNQQWQLSS